MAPHSTSSSYTPDEERQLLRIARITLENIGLAQPPIPFDGSLLSPSLLEERACFVTLTVMDTGDLRGCTGTLVARQPLADEVVYTTRQTALSDPRFAPVEAHEVPYLHIEISVLTPMQPLYYTDAEDLLAQLHPMVDGVTLVYKRYRSTFLPQVWERIPEKERFLDLLCEKMRLPAHTWQKEHMEVYTYQSVVIEEPHWYSPHP